MSCTPAWLSEARKSWGKWILMMGGLLAVGSVGARTIPVENQLRIDLPRGQLVRRVEIEIADDSGDTWRTAEIFAPLPNPPSLDYVASLPRGTYQIATHYEILTADELDKNHGGGWTRKTVRHQIRLEGADHHFPPPKDEAK